MANSVHRRPAAQSQQCNAQHKTATAIALTCTFVQGSLTDLAQAEISSIFVIRTVPNISQHLGFLHCHSRLSSDKRIADDMTRTCVAGLAGRQCQDCDGGQCEPCCCLPQGDSLHPGLCSQSQDDQEQGLPICHRADCTTIVCLFA